MALTDIKVRTAKPTDKQYKLTDGSGMHLFVHPNGSKYWFNVHLPTHVGTDDGISGSIMLVPTGRG